MHPPVRSQQNAHIDQEVYSLTSAIEPGEAPGARQEFKDEADINKLLRRFGVGVPQRQVTYGAMDFDVDLQQAYAAIADVKQAWRVMPEEIKRKYATWKQLIEAIDKGELKFDPTKPAGQKVILDDDGKSTTLPTSSTEPRNGT